MAIGNISISLTLSICPCKAAQAECQRWLLEQRVLLKVFLKTHCSYEPTKLNLSLNFQRVTQLLTQLTLPEHPHLRVAQQFAGLP